MIGGEGLGDTCLTEAVSDSDVEVSRGRRP